MFRIYWYATASTDSAAYIIGGIGDGPSPDGVFYSTIAEYKNNKWRKFGDLTKKRGYSSAIFFNGEYIIVGGYVEDRGR